MKRFLLGLCVAFLALACAANAPAPAGHSSQAASSNPQTAEHATPAGATDSQHAAGATAATDAASEQTAAQRATSEEERQTLNKALLRAAEAGETAKVSALLKRGADANASNSIRVARSPLSVLMVAVVHGHVETARGLIENGANVNATADFPDGGTTAPQKGVTALMQAAASGDLPMVKLLVEHGADVNARDGDGVTALMGTTDGKVIAYLLEHKADPNVSDKAGNTALINLAKHSRFGDASSVAAAEALLSKNADVNAANQNGETPLGVAEQTGKDELVALFKKAGAKK
jgi:ankyrin repeat protein